MRKYRTTILYLGLVFGGFAYGFHVGYNLGAEVEHNKWQRAIEEVKEELRTPQEFKKLLIPKPEFTRDSITI